jgi:putative transposase
VIPHCAWRDFRFALRFREVEKLVLDRGVTVFYETIRRWCMKFGQQHPIRCTAASPGLGDKGHSDEVFIKINGEQKYLWRAVDQDGMVLVILVHNRRDKTAARRVFRRPVKRTRTVPRVAVTDKLRFYGAAHRKAMPSVEHHSRKGLNNRAENSDQPTRRREHAMDSAPFEERSGSCPRSAVSVAKRVVISAAGGRGGHQMAAGRTCGEVSVAAGERDGERGSIPSDGSDLVVLVGPLASDRYVKRRM